MDSCDADAVLDSIELPASLFASAAAMTSHRLTVWDNIDLILVRFKLRYHEYKYVWTCLVFGQIESHRYLLLWIALCEATAARSNELQRAFGYLVVPCNDRAVLTRAVPRTSKSFLSIKDTYEIGPPESLLFSTTIC